MRALKTDIDMTELITPTQIKEKHPEWTDEQISDEFDNLAKGKIVDAIGVLRTYTYYLKNDPILKDQDAYKFVADLVDDGVAVFEPLFTGFGCAPFSSDELKAFDKAVKKSKKSHK